MSKGIAPRRTFLGSLCAAVAAPFAGLTGRARAEPNIRVVGVAASSLRLPPVIEQRLRAEADRLRECIFDPSISPERRAQYFAARQALGWAIEPGVAMAPAEAVNRNLCCWPAHDAKPVGAGEFADA